MEELSLQKFIGFAGEIHLPGSKSIANRAILLSALAKGNTLLSNLPLADDIEVLLTSLLILGIRIEAGGHLLTDHKEIREQLSLGSSFLIHGNGGCFVHNQVALNLDNAGTALRPLVAVLSAGTGHYIVDGNPQMQKRPILDLVDALCSLGVDIKAPSGCPPVQIQASGICGGKVEMSGKVSSQFISAMMMAAPFFEKGLEIILPEEPVSKPYIDITISVLSSFGISVEKKGYKYFKINPGQTIISPDQYEVEADASAATYFLSAGALPNCGPVKILGLGQNSIQGDIGFLEILKKVGAQVDLGSDTITICGPTNNNGLQAIDVDMNHMPDAAMTLAVIALFCEGTTHIRNIENLRVKESERIRGLHLELVKLGATIVEDRDALHITPPTKFLSASIKTYEDHRMAMAFALASFGTSIKIQDPQCVSKTYRNFFDDFIPMTQV